MAVLAQCSFVLDPDYKTLINGAKTELSNTITQTKTETLSTIAQTYALKTQANEIAQSLQTWTNSFTETINGQKQVLNYLKFEKDVGLWVADERSSTSLLLKNDGLYIVESKNVDAAPIYINSNKVHVRNMELLETLKISSLTIRVKPNGRWEIF